VWGELKKLLSARDPSRALLWMRQSGVLSEILPETEKWGIDAIHGLVAAEQVLGWAVEPMLRLAAIVPPDRERLAALSARLRLSKAEASYLSNWASAPAADPDLKDTALDRLLYRQGVDGMKARLKLALAAARADISAGDTAMQKVARFSTLLARAEKFHKPAFPLSGADVMAAGVEAGPKVGDLLKSLEEKWIDVNFSLDRAALTARLKDMLEH